ncbi:alpha/beta fold hydrolase [Blastomonas sp.]|uniref:alpha/beta fold hydrolase n=1 Tax=Blastomonas sp. TaxID=1909299 RepID=UPI003593321A
MLSIKTFGTMQVTRDGQPVALPASRKSRALLAYLALTDAPQRRDRLCELFWEIPDDPRGALRWSLSKLRPVVKIDGETRLLADRERVRLDTSAIKVDFLEFRAVANEKTHDVERLAAAWSNSDHQLLEDCDLPNQPSFVAWLEQQRNEVTRLRIKVARYLAHAPELTPEDAEKWPERWLIDAPFDPAAARQAVLARRRLGREHEANELAAELDRAFHEAGLESPSLGKEPAPQTRHQELVVSRETNLSPPRQSIRFVQADDGSSLAWATVGNPNHPPLVKAANWLSHLELDWEAPIWSPLFRNLATSFNFIRYDERGCGLSDWDVPKINLESFVTDLEVVVDAAGLDRFPLLGISQGAAVSIEFAARHPERISHLILFGGYPAGWRHTASDQEAREREAVMVLTETGWGRDNPAYRHLFSQTFMPTATSEELAWFDEFQRLTTTPKNAVRFLQAFADIDIRHRLKDVKAPTLVVHSRNDMRIPVETGQSMAAQIGDAQFVGLDSANHLLLGREDASLEFVRAVREFLNHPTPSG